MQEITVKINTDYERDGTIYLTTTSEAYIKDVAEMTRLCDETNSLLNSGFIVQKISMKKMAHNGDPLLRITLWRD